MVPYESRRSRLIHACPDTVDAVLVTRLVNVGYLTGFTGSNGAVLLGRDVEAVLAIDGRYTLQAGTEAPDINRVEARAVAAALVAHAAAVGVRRLGIDAGHITLALADELRGVGGEATELVPLPPVVEPLRAVKDAGEIDRLRQACAITDLAFADLAGWLHATVTEREVADRLALAVREHGGDGLAFESIVAFGPNSAIPHHRPSDRPLVAGDLVKVDFGARHAGYHADMTRTVVLGSAAGWQRDLHGEVQQIQARCRAGCVPGAVPAQLDAKAGEAIRSGGNVVAHGLGHGVGLQIHEEPFLTPGSAAGPLTEAMTVTIEPGIYLPGRGGVRIEDTLLVTTTGPEPLTRSSRELLEVG